MTKTYLITGANRGIGFELARQLSARGDRVLATTRQPQLAEALQKLASDQPLVRVLACDVTDEKSIGSVARELADSVVDVLINNAGVFLTHGSLADFSAEEALLTLQINSIGPVLVTRAMLPALRRARGAKILNLTSILGSIAQTDHGGDHAYRMSKAALAMATRCLAADLREDDIAVVAAHPGWVKTDMGGESAPIALDESVLGLIGLIDRVSSKESGGVFDYRGRTIPF